MITDQAEFSGIAERIDATSVAAGIRMQAHVAFLLLFFQDAMSRLPRPVDRYGLAFLPLRKANPPLGPALTLGAAFHPDEPAQGHKACCGVPPPLDTTVRDPASGEIKSR